MAHYAAVVSLVQLLQEVSHRDLYLHLHIDRQQIASLCEKLTILQQLLENCSPKDEESVEFLEKRVREAAYRAQDVVESHISDQIHRKRRARGFGELGFDNVVEQVKEEVEFIVEELTRSEESFPFHEDLRLSFSSANNEAALRQEASGGDTMVGFDEALTTIKDQLCGGSSKLEVISITGMGGIGKTTLARKLFDDELILYRFYCRVWVYVSQDYHLRKILLDIGNSMNIIIDEKFLNLLRKGDEVKAEGPVIIDDGKLRESKDGVAVNVNAEKVRKERDEILKEHIYKHLKGRRYLIIMDDVWDTKVWDDVKRLFPDDSNGSRVVITTRLLDVAMYADSHHLRHKMQFLNEDQSWNLFCAKVFCPPELEDIGREIAKNCRGLPLAIVVVAGLLSKLDKARHDWGEVERNIVSLAASENDEHLSRILSLSYNHLPHHLKSCFLYLGGFPEDYEIHVAKLIKLWIAEGLLKTNESKSLEEVGEEYLEDLVNRNLVLVTKRRSNGKFKYCSMHDLLRDLCAERASREDFLYIQDESNFFFPVAIGKRRTYIHHGWLNRSIHLYPSGLKCDVRSIIFFRCVKSVFDDSLTELGFKLLRILDAIIINFSFFPMEVLKLFHLRYLAVSLSGDSFPLSISVLQNLQTLIVRLKKPNPQMLFTFPLWKMPQLRHVCISQVNLSPIPYGERIVGGVRFLGRLQTLSRVVDFIFTADTVEKLPSLKKLKLLYTKQKWQEFGLNNLVCLQKLETLEIKFLFNLHYSKLAIPLPRSFAFPVNLKKLTLEFSMLPWKDMTVVASLHNLQVLKLRQLSFMGEEWELEEVEFRRLRFLEMSNLLLKYWRAENTNFPRLEHLVIRDCAKLREIPTGIGETLELIEVFNSSFVVDPALAIQEEQRELGNDVLQVRVYG